MQYGNPVSDPLCGRCKQKIEMAVLTEAVYQEGRWWHTACHRAGVSQLLQATWLADVFTADKREVELIHSPLFQGDEPPGWHAE
jgi:phage terminase large subunit GpA-like protein